MLIYGVCIGIETTPNGKTVEGCVVEKPAEAGGLTTLSISSAPTSEPFSTIWGGLLVDDIVWCRVDVLICVVISIT